jgi:chromosome segregation ATPase
MLKLRQNYVDTQEQLSAAKLKISELEAELATTKRALVTAQSDCKSMSSRLPFAMLTRLKSELGRQGPN